MRKEEIIANRLIEEMRADGLSYGQMLDVFRIVIKRFEELMKVRKERTAE